MTNLNLQQWIQHPEMLNKDTLYDLRMQLIRYPYCQTLRLLYLKNLFLLHDISFGGELRKSTLYITDRSILFYLLEGDTAYPLEIEKKILINEEDTDSQDRTLFLIDNFLSNLPEESITHIELDYTTDYTSYLLQEDNNELQTENSPQLKGIELIDGFIERSENEQVVYLAPQADDVKDEHEYDEDVNSLSEPTHQVSKSDEEDCFTETLAKIYIKQRRYSKALEIIKKLSLKYPKKNAYFADQIRFLEKLIINAKSK